MLGLVAKKSGEDADIQFNVRVFWDTGQDLEKEAALFAAGILCRKSSKFASNVLSDLLSAAKGWLTVLTSKWCCEGGRTYRDALGQTTGSMSGFGSKL